MMKEKILLFHGYSLLMLVGLSISAYKLKFCFTEKKYMDLVVIFPAVIFFPSYKDLD